jgi:serine/threonine protein phosphatase 1
MSNRVIAIGDIHGCSAALSALLDAIRPQPEDTLVPLGDYVNKGPDSRRALERLLLLRSQCRLIPLLGNHDQLMLDAVAGNVDPDEWMDQGGAATLESYGHSVMTGSIPQRHIEFLKSCRLFFETDRHFFVHAAYVPELPLAQQEEAVLTTRSLRDSIPAPHISGKTAVVGHTSQKSGEVLDAGHLICIDTNCWAGGWLTALDITNGRMWQTDVRGRLRRRTA